MILHKIKEKIPLPVKRGTKNLAYNIGDSFQYFPGGWNRRIGSPAHILFVCYGNICRSIFAEKVLRKMLPQTKVGIESCGLSEAGGISSPREAVEIAKRFEIDLSDHQSKSILACDVDRAELVLAMEFWQLTLLREKYPERQERFMLLRPFAPLPHSLLCNINDPYGSDLKEFHRCFSLISTSLRSIAARL
jgi:protein-tyrosine phosphatase